MKALIPWRMVLALYCALCGGWPELACAQKQEAKVSTETRELSLSVGENRTVSATEIKSYSEGAPGIVEIRLTPDGGEFVVVGKQPGNTTLLLIQRDGKQLLYVIAVFPRPMEAVENEVSRLLADDTGIRIRRVGPRLFIEGGVSTDPELQRIAHIASLYPGQVESLVVLGGSAAERKHNVRLDVFFIQFERRRDFNVGVRWPGSVGPVTATAGFDLLKPGFIQGTAQIIDQPLLGLDLAQVNGWARVLKHSTVITSNGAEATFSSGGEQNYRVVGGLAAQLEQLEFGTEVKVLPRYDPVTREVQVKVSAHVADLTAPVAPGADLPGRSLSKSDTQVTLKLGQALVLSGVHTSADRGSNSGLPGLSQIPILGALFGSQDRSQEEIDGALFLVPTVIDAVPKSARDLVNEMLDVYDAFDRDVKHRQRIPMLDPPESPAPPRSPELPKVKE